MIFLYFCTVFFFFCFQVEANVSNSVGVHWVVVGKTNNQRQDISDSNIFQRKQHSNPHFLNLCFFAEIFMSTKGKALDGATLSGPGLLVNPIKFPDHGDYDRELRSKRYDSLHLLDNDYPNGDYWIHYNISSGTPSKQVVYLKKIYSVDHIPDPIVVTLFQKGKQVDSMAVSSFDDLVVTWSRFKNGGPDPNHICPDLEFFEVGDCWGNSILHSGMPFITDKHEELTYLNTSYTIPKELLKPKQIFQISIEHAKIMTNQKDGIPSMGTFATNTFLDFHTLGTASTQSIQKDVCPSFPIQMDCGQTDRPSNPNLSC